MKLMLAALLTPLVIVVTLIFRPSQNPKSQADPFMQAHATKVQVAADAQALIGIQKRWQGKKVWGYGGLTFFCSTRFGGETYRLAYHQPATISQITWIYPPEKTLIALAGGYGGLAVTLPDPPSIEVERFLEVTFVDTQAAHLAASWSASNWQIEQPKSCTPYLNVAIDEAHMQRLYSRVAPNPKLARVNNPIGLTTWQVAWLSGFPDNTKGDLVTLLKAKEWAYKSILGSNTYQFKQGRVVAYNFPRLP